MKSQGPPPDAGRVLCAIDRRDDNELRVAVREYNGHKFIDIRQWWTPDDGADKRPGKGVTVKTRELLEVSSALDRALRIVEGLPEEDPDPTEGWADG